MDHFYVFIKIYPQKYRVFKKIDEFLEYDNIFVFGRLSTPQIF